MQQYKGYALQHTDYGIIVRDSRGNYLKSYATEKEAIEAIDDVDLDSLTVDSISIDWFRKFEDYCKNMPNRIKMNDKFYAKSESILKRYIKSFEKANNVEIEYSYEYIDNEYFYYITSIESC